MDFRFSNEVIKSNLLNFIQVEFEPFLDDDHTYPASFRMGSGITQGYSVSDLLDKLLKIAIGRTIEEAILDFDKCTRKESSSFQYIAALHGINIDSEIQLSENIKLVPPGTSALMGNMIMYTPEPTNYDLKSRTLVVIKNVSISPLFAKPCMFHSPLPFKIDFKDQDNKSSNTEDFFSYLSMKLFLAFKTPIDLIATTAFCPI